MFAQCGRPTVQNVTARQHFRIIGHKRMAMKTVTNETQQVMMTKVATSDVAPVVDITTFMK